MFPFGLNPEIFYSFSFPVSTGPTNIKFKAMKNKRDRKQNNEKIIFIINEKFKRIS